MLDLIIIFASVAIFAIVALTPDPPEEEEEYPYDPSYQWTRAEVEERAGVYLEGSTRLEDLSGAVSEILFAFRIAGSKVGKELHAIDWARVDSDPEEEERARWVVDEAIDLVDEIIGPHGYGASAQEYDPACFGVWRFDDPEEEEYDPDPEEEDR